MQPSNLLILRTNITNNQKKKIIEPLLDQHPHIKLWSLDLEDIDKVLRVETTKNIQEKDIILLLKQSGFWGEDLDNEVGCNEIDTTFFN